VTNQINYKFVENSNTNLNYIPTQNNNTNSNIDSSYKAKDDIYKSNKSGPKEDAKINYLYSIKK